MMKRARVRYREKALNRFAPVCFQRWRCRPTVAGPRPTGHFGDEGPKHYVPRSDQGSRACSVLSPNGDIFEVPVNHSEGARVGRAAAGDKVHARHSIGAILEVKYMPILVKVELRNR